MNLPDNVFDVLGIFVIKNQLYIIQMDPITIYASTRNQFITCLLESIPISNFGEPNGKIYRINETSRQNRKHAIALLDQVANNCKWREMASFENKMFSHILVSCGGFLRVIGGLVINMVLSGPIITVERCSCITNMVEETTPIVEARISASAVSINCRIFVISSVELDFRLYVHVRF